MRSKWLVLGFVLVLSALILSGCGSSEAEPTALPTAVPTEVATEQPTEVPTATPTEVAVEAPDPVRARDVALAYASGRYGEQAPALGLTWAEENITPVGLVGSSSFQYTAGDWVVTVSFPLVAPQATIYQVVATNQTTGFQWEGEVDATGQVTEQTVVGAADVVYEGISFSYDDELATETRAETMPAVPETGDPTLPAAPEHIEFLFVGYTLPETFHEPRIIIYPVEEYEAISERAEINIGAMRQLLVDKPAKPEAIPFLPLWNAGQLMGTQATYVDFKNGTGVRIVTQFGQAFVPINNHELFYTFQGLTSDGNYYVAAILPVSHPSLPADGTEVPGDDWAAFSENFETYVADIEQKLETQEASSFTPDLSLLDAMIQSLEVAPTSTTPPPAPTPTPVQSWTEPVENWWGEIVSNPPGSQFDDYFQRQIVNGGQYGIESLDPDIQAQIVALRDTGTTVHVWGTLHHNVPDYNASQIQVTRLEVQEVPAPPEITEEPVDGWIGTIIKYPILFQLDDYFERDDGQRFGIGAIDAAVRQQIEALRWTGAQVQVWGQLLTGVPDAENRQIQVERIEAVSGPAEEARNLSPFAEPSASSVLPADRWGTYAAFSAIDNSLSSPWTEGVDGPGVGEWIMLEFPGIVEVYSIGIDVGYDRDEGDTLRSADLFTKNNRLKRATLIFSNGEQVELNFTDTRGVQMFHLVRAPGPNIETTFVKVVIEEVYPGSKYDDTCLAEIEVWGKTK